MIEIPNLLFSVFVILYTLSIIFNVFFFLERKFYYFPQKEKLCKIELLIERKWKLSYFSTNLDYSEFIARDETRSRPLEEAYQRQMILDKSLLFNIPTELIKEDFTLEKEYKPEQWLEKL